MPFENLKTPHQVFIQAVLLMSVFEQRVEFLNVVKCRWESGGAISYILGSSRSPGGGSGR